MVIFNGEGTIMFSMEVANRSAVSLPRILMWLGTQRYLTDLWDKRRLYYVKDFIMGMKGEVEELKGLDWRERRYDWESETIYNYILLLRTVTPNIKHIESF